MLTVFLETFLFLCGFSLQASRDRDWLPRMGTGLVHNMTLE